MLSSAACVPPYFQPAARPTVGSAAPTTAPRLSSARRVSRLGSGVSAISTTSSSFAERRRRSYWLARMLAALMGNQTVPIGELDLARFEPGKHELWLELPPGLPRPRRIPALVAVGRGEAATVVAAAAVHGDEFEGIR